MFDNIGGKIKSLAKVITWIGIGVSVILGVVLFTVSVVAGILFIVVGALVSWVGSFLLYGFGELIENTSQMKKNMDAALITLENTSNDVDLIKLQLNQKKSATYVKVNESTGEQLLYCSKCGKANIPTLTYCSGCGSKLSN